MKLFDIFIAGRKPYKTPAKRVLSSAVPQPKVPLENSMENVFRQNFANQDCTDDSHDFVCSYPVKCRKCGLVLQWEAAQIEKYMGSYFDGVAYQWTDRMKTDDIISFSISAGDRPVFEANCDFSVLTVRNCLHGSRDGWMASKYPKRFFDPKEIMLRETDTEKIKRHLANMDFSNWKTPAYYVENHDAPGFFVEKRFSCVFTNGKKFTCLGPENEEFDQLVSMLHKIAVQNSAKAGRAFFGG